MLISVNKDVENVDFEKLITLATNTLQETSTKQNDRYLTLLGNKLEDEVYDVMCSCAQNTPFEGTIELVSGQKFPDIIANNYYGGNNELKEKTLYNGRSSGSNRRCIGNWCNYGPKRCHWKIRMEMDKEKSKTELVEMGQGI